MKTVEQYDVLEISVQGEIPEKPYVNGKIWGVFESSREKKTVKGFYDGENLFRVRFMPSFAGEYRYRIYGSGIPEQTGSFLVTEAGENNHGMVRATQTGFFEYSDGTPYYPVGTTCYAWVHQSFPMREKTVETLSRSPFNKIRMCVFPKHYVFNQIDPELFPFPRGKGTEAGEEPEGKDWNYEEFDPAFFRNIEKYIGKLLELGIEADLILFHPYDKWGFSELPAEVNDRYLDYVVARFGAYRNVWWSLANEYDFMEKKTAGDWEHYGSYLWREDIYHHLIGVHNAIKIYDPDKLWLTHLSIQNQEVREYAKMGRELREKYGKPVIFDEVGYEGNINAIWGCLTPKMFLWRCYEAVFGGCYVTHGETFYSEKEDLWWSHGGVLKGEAAPRLAFLRKLLEETPGNGLESVEMVWDDTAAHAREDSDYLLFYYGIYRPVIRDFYRLEETADYHVEIIDTWNMTVEDRGILHGHFDLSLPGRDGMLVRVRKVK